MKNLIFVCVFTASLFTQSRIVLTDGSQIEGKILEHRFKLHIKINMTDGEIRTVDYSQIKSVTFFDTPPWAPDRPPRASSAQEKIYQGMEKWGLSRDDYLQYSKLRKRANMNAVSAFLYHIGCAFAAGMTHIVVWDLGNGPTTALNIWVGTSCLFYTGWAVADAVRARRIRLEKIGLSFSPNGLHTYSSFRF